VSTHEGKVLLVKIAYVRKAINLATLSEANRHTDSISDVFCSERDNIVISAGFSKQISIWSCELRRQTFCVHLHAPCTAMFVDPALGDMLVTACTFFKQLCLNAL
jgi:WD40 repeat protein